MKPNKDFDIEFVGLKLGLDVICGCGGVAKLGDANT